MNVITVIPLSRSKLAPELSYFTSSDIPVGAVVTVPLRSKTIHAIVIGSRPAEEIKTEIRRAPFMIRKLQKIKATTFFPATFIQSCIGLADHYATSVGAVINTLVADAIIDNIGKISIPFDVSGKSSARILAVQGDDDDRLSTWRSLIRQEFARKKSVVIYVPTVDDCDKLYALLEKGIEGYIFRLNAAQSAKIITACWKTLAESSHPVVIVATGSFPILPRNDIESVIIERENARGWITQKSPYIDFRQALEIINKKNGRNVYMADSMLRTETLYRIEQNEVDTGSPFKWRSVSTAHDSLVDMRIGTDGSKQSVSEEGARKFQVLSPELISLIRQNRNENTHLFILTIRRGLSPTTICDDCGAIVACRNCSAPMVLHTSPENGKNFFMCHICGERRNAKENCAYCGGWRLTPLGIGTDRVFEAIGQSIPDADIFRIDADTIKSERRSREIMSKFRLHPGGILLGTEMALNRLSEKVDHIAVVSFDSLFALPDFRMQEKIMYMLVRLRALSWRSFLVQTRRPTEKVFEYGLKGNLSDFFRVSLEDRRKFSYPPFFTLIKITIEGTKDSIATQMAEISDLLSPREVDVFPAFTATVRGKSVIHGLVKIDSRAWPDSEMIAKLRSLPPSVSIRINPESLL